MVESKSQEIVILTGAGFSKAFGLPLAREFNTYLANNPNIRDNQFLFDLLNNHKDFEKVYSLLLERDDKDFKVFSTAVKDCFEKMNSFCKGVPKQGEKIFTFKKLIENYFLGKNDGSCLNLFTLNQDILLEQLVELRACNRGGLELLYPGIGNICKQEGKDYKYDVDIPEQCMFIRNKIDKIDIEMDSEFKEIFSTQERQRASLIELSPVYKICYFKLHGSSNWFLDGEKMMIVGADKKSQIDDNKLISMYFEEFVKAIENRKLLVIGYGFKDSHVNDIIFNSVENSKTKVYYISPGANFSNIELGNVKEFIYNMFPFSLDELINYDCRQSGRMPFETKEILRALNFL